MLQTKNNSILLLAMIIISSTITGGECKKSFASLFAAQKSCNPLKSNTMCKAQQACPQPCNNSQVVEQKNSLHDSDMFDDNDDDFITVTRKPCKKQKTNTGSSYCPLTLDASAIEHIEERHIYGGSKTIDEDGNKRSLFNSNEKWQNLVLTAWEHGRIVKGDERALACNKSHNFNRTIGKLGDGTSAMRVKVVKKDDRIATAYPH